MDFVQWHQINELAVRQMGKPAVYVSNGLEYVTDKEKAIWEHILTKVNNRDHTVDLIYGGIFFFDTMDEAQAFYGIFNEYPVESSPVYACLYSPGGVCLTENT